MPAPTAETILAALKRVPLLSASQLRRVEEAAGRGSHPPERVVGRLVEKGWATKFQAEALLTGKAETLVVGPYLLLDVLGEGGMGRVFRAKHVRLGRIDAVKVIRADKLASRTLARRFAREIRLTASLEHPHIVRALDAGEARGRLYLATEFIDGQDLGTTVFRGGPLTPADACLAAYQACLALQYVSDRGLVHRDVKPSNLMRESATRAVKLMDLGLSGVRAGDGAASMAGGMLTTDGVMLGTPDFMSPEQARNPHGADIRADLYGLGATMFFLLSGRTPFTGSAVDKLMAHASQPVPPVMTPAGPAPPPLAALVTRLMAKKPDDRYPTPAAVAEALLALRPAARPEVVAPAAGQVVDTVEPSEVLPAEAWQSEFEVLIDQAESQARARVVPPPARGPRWGWVLGTAALTLTIGVLVGALGRNRTPAPEPEPAVVAHPPTPAEELRDLRAAVASTEDREAVRRRVLDFRAKYPGTPNATAAAGLLRKLPSPLDRLAGNGAPFVVASGTGPAVGALAFTPNDTRLVVARDSQAPEELTLPELMPTARFQTGIVGERATGLTPDGRGAVGTDAAGRLLVWSGAHFVILRAPGEKVRHASLTPDGKAAIVVPQNADSQLLRVEIPTDRVSGRLPVVADGVRDVLVSADGSACVVFGESWVRVVPVAVGQPVRAIEPMADIEGPPIGVVSPDGGRLYLARIERMPGRYQAGADRSDLSFELRPEARRWLWGTPPVPRASALAVAADETMVAVGTGGGRLTIFETGSGRIVSEQTLPGGVKVLAFSSSGRVLAAALDGGRVVLVPLGK